MIAALPGAMRAAQGIDWRARILGGYFRKWVVLGILIGIVAGLGAIAFFEAIDIATQLFLGHLIGLTPPVAAGEGSTLVTSADR
ncbi:MAG: chloride channel protein, partial [Dehalococcoidia bacterium]